jgi:hypothetical protein
VLADDGLDRELAYTALSRGRHSNRLYVSREHDAARAEYAPQDGDTREALERLAAAMRSSSAQVLAIDAGAPVPARAALADAERAYTEAAARRRAAESARIRWVPARRRELLDARRGEAETDRRLRETRRALIEHRHQAQPFETEQEREAATSEVAEPLAERRLAREREAGRARGLGR